MASLYLLLIVNQLLQSSLQLLLYAFQLCVVVFVVFELAYPLEYAVCHLEILILAEQLELELLELL